MKYAVILSGGKQFLVKKDDVIQVDKVDGKENETIEFETLALFDTDSKDLELGKPYLKKKVKGKIVKHLKGEKIRVARFKAKVRYRKIKGFRPELSEIKILSI